VYAGRTDANKDTPLAQASIKYEALAKDGAKHEDWYPLFVPRKAKHTVRARQSAGKSCALCDSRLTRLLGSRG